MFIKTIAPEGSVLVNQVQRSKVSGAVPPGKINGSASLPVSLTPSAKPLIPQLHFHEEHKSKIVYFVEIFFFVDPTYGMLVSQNLEKTFVNVQQHPICARSDIEKGDTGIPTPPHVRQPAYALSYARNSNNIKLQ